MPLIPYKVTDSVSGETEVYKAVSPVSALIRFLLNRTPVNPKGGIWNWDIEVVDLDDKGVK